MGPDVNINKWDRASRTELSKFFISEFFPWTKHKQIAMGEPLHYIGAMMSVMASQITGVSIVCSTICSGGDQRKQRQSSASLAFVKGIRRWPVDSPHKGASNAENVSIWWRHYGNLREFIWFISPHSCILLHWHLDNLIFVLVNSGNTLSSFKYFVFPYYIDVVLILVKSSPPNAAYRRQWIG